MWSNTTLLEKYAPEIESWQELLLRSELMMIENHHLLDNALPLLPHVVTVAGCTAHPAKPLPASLEKIFQESNEGVIMVTFGSSANRMRTDIATRFLEAFGRLKETVVIRMAVSKGVDVSFSLLY